MSQGGIYYSEKVWEFLYCIEKNFGIGNFGEIGKL